ncbi:TPA: anti-phage dCTP deaminase [Yersinia enterocolitica]|uniref:anti-phage dCTP deaminase n=1 Tax=Yersinia TaxID=629 RepID=UPI001D0F4D10|nr:MULTISPECIES: anti-phage dCTP deaminase [Yersinia]EKN3600683.1 cytidine deaminase [Yersinia enterocolitica]EKN4024425.1 cytidine deaminase [Yersinia enterocolitica]EKN4088064.1 cytidine deaminase [Yersinia enterocolitica]EKN5129102.1 cytidine deaminase [Yersinia enterocolitica]EKN6413007.1 cytidine deaminase [Yersinia enterocolitica]
MKINKITEIIKNNNSILIKGVTHQSLYENNTPPPTELIIGLVCSVGTNLENITSKIKERLSLYDFDFSEIRISTDIIDNITGADDYKNNYQRIDKLMSKGNKLRQESECNYILALGAISKINEIRKKTTLPYSKKGIAYVINSIKHPEEVHELRKVYGSGFLLFGVFSDKKRRLDNLTLNKGIEQEDAEKLIERDEEEDSGHGQHTRDTFHLADFFLNQDGRDDKLNNDIKRIFDLLFGNPFITPTFDEFAMYMAFSSALRSADLSRQVGAVLAKNHTIISTGANDVPRFGGGLYWPNFDQEKEKFEDFPDGRDYVRGFDSNAMQKKQIVEDILKNIPKSSKEKIKKILNNSLIQDITEYGRVVHAEMEAILACARSNISTYDSSIYCTTFPCHNCAKHIIASGIKRVIYIEPYPKSKAYEFHAESISTDNISTEKVIFEPFIGIGPRVFFNLFSLVNGNGNRIKRKNKDGTVVEWDEKNTSLRISLLPVSYLEREEISVNLFGNIIGV